jgi:hypothetical protein
MWPLLLVVATGAVLWTVAAYRATRPDPGRRLRRILTALRGTAFVLLLLGAAAPVVSRLGSESLTPRLVVVIEDSASMAVEDAAGGRSRWDQARLMAAAAESLLAARGTPVEVEILGGNGLEALEPLRSGYEPDGRGTDLNRLADQALRRAAGQPVPAVLLVSDGQETRSAGPVRRPGGGPALLVAGVGDPEGPADRLIRDLRHPESVHRGDDIVLEFLVDHRHEAPGGPQDLRVTLKGPEGVLADTLLGAVGGTRPVALVVPAAREGLLVADLSVSPLVNERFLANNTMSLAVDVKRDRARVLLLAERPGWDVRFLAQAAADEPRLALTVVQPSARGMVRADSLTSWTPPVGAEAWLTWDAVIVTGWRGDLARMDWQGLAEAVGRGRGLLVLPGGDALVPGMPGRPPAALEGLLPIEASGWAWQAGSWRVDAAAGGGRHPLLAGLEGAPADWPPLEGLVSSALKPGAVAVLEAAGRAGLDRDGRPRPVLVTGSAGEGRIVWFGGRRLWELAFAELAPGAASTDGREGAGRRLLRNMLVWTAAGDQEAGLTFIGRQSVHPEGEPIRLGVRWRDMRGAPVVGRAANVTVRRAGADSTAGDAATYALRPRSGGGLEAVLPPLPPGRYTARLRGAGDPPVTGDVLEFVVAGQSVEAGQVRRDQRRLDLLAAALGTEALDGDAPDAVRLLAAGLEGVDWSARQVMRRERWDLWAGWPFLVLVTVVLGAEWLLRRRAGLL